MFLLQEGSDPAAAAHILAVMLPLIGLFCIIAFAIILIPFWFICKKAGFSPWLSLLNIIPLGNIVLLYILAFAEWKTVPKAPAFAVQPPIPPAPPLV
jgi:hypothetical protein